MSKLCPFSQILSHLGNERGQIPPPPERRLTSLKFLNCFVSSTKRLTGWWTLDSSGYAVVVRGRQGMEFGDLCTQQVSMFSFIMNLYYCPPLSSHQRTTHNTQLLMATSTTSVPFQQDVIIILGHSPSQNSFNPPGPGRVLSSRIPSLWTLKWRKFGFSGKLMSNEMASLFLLNSLHYGNPRNLIFSCQMEV